jgi:glucan phosphoethanolaminetransferase (alkaline phosphatase superfamily)
MFKITVICLMLWSFCVFAFISFYHVKFEKLCSQNTFKTETENVVKNKVVNGFSYLWE